MSVRTDCDLLIIGAGPAGLSAATYGASEGLRTLVIAPKIGGQAADSTLIENVEGWPHGVSGAALTRRGRRQAQRLGARFVRARVVDLQASNGLVYAQTEAGGVVVRAAVVACGMAYRKLDLPGARGVYYGATPLKAARGRQVVVVGGGNSAGQAAYALSKVAAAVTLVTRRGIAATMSDYLVRKLAGRVTVTVGRLEALDTRSGRVSGARVDGREVPATMVTVFVGMEPNTGFLRCEKDGRGFLVCDAKMHTRLKGVFAAGDARSGSMKRVATAVGEGANVVAEVQTYLGGE